MEDVFQTLEYEVTSEFRVIQPHYLQDSEVTEISMSMDRLSLRLVNRGAIYRLGEETRDGMITRIDCLSPQFIDFKTHHLQNVVDSVFVVPHSEIAVFDLHKELGSNVRAVSFGRNFSILIAITSFVSLSVLIGAERVKFSELR